MATPIVNESNLETTNEVTAPIFVKDVRRNKETRDWDAFVTCDGNEIYLGSCQWSWDAEAICDEYVHQQLMSLPVTADAFPREQISADEMEHEAMIGAESVTTYNGVTITHETSRDGSVSWTMYKRGDFDICVEDKGVVIGNDTRYSTMEDVADIQAVAAAVLANRSEGECDSCHTFSSSLKNGLCPRCRITTLHTAVVYERIPPDADDEDPTYTGFDRYRCGDVELDEATESGAYWLWIDTQQKKPFTVAELRTIQAQLGALIDVLPGTPVSQIAVTPRISDDTIDKALYGTHVWTDYSIGNNGTEVTFFTDDTEPELNALGGDGIPLSEVDRILPEIIALMSSPEVKAARAAWEARQVRQPMKKAA